MKHAFLGAAAIFTSMVACSSSTSTLSTVGGTGGNGTGGGGGTDASDLTDGSSTASDGGSTSATDGSSTAPTTLVPGTSSINLSIAGKSRSAVLYVPKSATSTAALVIALHGDGDTDTNFLATSGLQPLADKDGFVIAAPQGITRDVTVQSMTVPQVDWDAYNSVANGNIDLPLLEALRTQLQATQQIDAQKTFVFGYSQGGYMAFLYGMTDSPVLSCSGVLAASSPYGGGAGDPLITGATRKIAVAMQIGTQDSAYSAAEATEATLKSNGFPTQFTPVPNAGHVPIPGDISVPLGFCLGQTL